MKTFSNLSSSIIDVFEVMFIGVAVFAIVYLFVGQPLEITGSSMEPNLHNGEMIIAEKVSSKLSRFKRGDIVVFKQPENKQIFVIKRIIGLPGESLTLKREGIYTEGNLIDESFLTTGTLPFSGDEEVIKIPNDSYYLMGDNRGNSTDSRKWGPIAREDIVGKAVLVFNPFSKARFINTTFELEDIRQRAVRFVEAFESK